MEKELVQVEEDWARAMVSNNVEEIGRFMAEDWVIVSTEGGVTSKADFLSIIRSGDLTHHQMDYEDMRIKVYENSAVVTCLGTSAGHYKGNPFSYYEWSTDVFVKTGNGWRCVLTMLAPAHSSR